MAISDEFADIRLAIDAAARRAFAALYEEYPEEHFYAFGLCCGGAGGSVSLIANSIESLKKDAEETVASPYSLYKTVKEAVEDRRWAPGNWEWISVAEEEFNKVNSLLHQQRKSLNLEADADEEAQERYAEQVHEVCTQVLADLHQEGFFGKGRARSKLTVLMILDDIGPQWVVDRVCRLNPKAVAARFEKQFAPTKGAEGECERLGSKTVYEMCRLACSADKKVLASLGTNLFACSRDEQTEWRELFLMRWDDQYGGLAISPDGKTLFAATNHDDARSGHLPNEIEIRRFDLTAGKKKELKKWALPARFTRLACSPDGRWLAATGEAKCFFVLNAETGEIVANPETGDWLSDVQFAPDGSVLATADYKATRLWHTRDWTALRSIEMPSRRIAFSPDGQWVALCTGRAVGDENKSTLAIAEVATGKLDYRVCRDEQINCVAFSPDGRWIAIGGDSLGRSATARLEAMRQGSASATDLPQPTSEAGQSAADFTPRATDKATLTLYDVKTAQEKCRLICGASHYSDVAFLDEEHVVFVSMDYDGSPPLGVWKLPPL